jgi:trans-aconitate 2-methyltransferase
MTWNPSQYLKFADHRTRPSFDLLARIDAAAPKIVYDLGCGPGNSTLPLRERWPEAQIIGVDSSAEMIAKAKTLAVPIEWVEADIATWRGEKPADIIFSNATLQWLGGHGTLMPKLFAQLAPGGILAVQMPRNHSAPSHVEMRETARSGPWRAKVESLMREAPVHSPDFYWDCLNGPDVVLDIWETEYLHQLTGDNPVVEWTKATGLRPFLDALDEPLRSQFLDDYKRRIAEAYPPRPDGVTLFPFRRLFIVAKRA